MSTPSASSHETCLRSLTNQVTLKFSECAEDVKDKFAATGRGINTLSHTPKPNPQCIQLRHHINQVFQRTPKPVKLPYNEYITGAHKGERLHEAWALSFRTAHGVGKDFFATSARERIFLQVKMLVKSGNTRVADIHTVTVSYDRVFGKMCNFDYALYYEIVQRKGLTSGEGSHRLVSYTEVCEMDCFSSLVDNIIL
jgi:hypothetical protein